MEDIELLRKLFDEKIISILNTVLDHSEDKLSLTEIAQISSVSIPTTSRILEKLILQDIIEIEKVGKSKFYKLKNTSKIDFLSKLLKKDEYLYDFIAKASKIKGIKKIMLDNKNKEFARLIIITSTPVSAQISQVSSKIDNKKFKIDFLEINEDKFTEIEKLGLYRPQKRVLWVKKN